jgi:hypothetical protein
MPVAVTTSTEHFRSNKAESHERSQPGPLFSCLAVPADFQNSDRSPVTRLVLVRICTLPATLYGIWFRMYSIHSIGLNPVTRGNISSSAAE